MLSTDSGNSPSKSSQNRTRSTFNHIHLKMKLPLTSSTLTWNQTPSFSLIHNNLFPPMLKTPKKKPPIVSFLSWIYYDLFSSSQWLVPCRPSEMLPCSPVAARRGVRGFRSDHRKTSPAPRRRRSSRYRRACGWEDLGKSPRIHRGDGKSPVFLGGFNIFDGKIIKWRLSIATFEHRRVNTHSCCKQT